MVVWLGASPAGAIEDYGPVNLVKTLPTPFGPPGTVPKSDKPEQAPCQMSISGQDGWLALPMAGKLSTKGLSGRLVYSSKAEQPAQTGSPIALNSTPYYRSLSEKLMQPHLYLPGRMVLGKPAEFVVRGKPGSHVALAMADRDSGAKPVYGHTLHLGPDRKLVSVGVIDDSGVLTLVIETPVEGDLIGQHLFFEAALWRRSDFSDLELAVPVTSEGSQGAPNGVGVIAEAEQKRGVKIVPDSGVPMQQRGAAQDGGLDSGRL